MKKIPKFKRLRYIIYVFIFLWFLIFYLLLVKPILFWVEDKSLAYEVDQDRLKDHVSYMVSFERQRAYKNLESLDKVWTYIYDQFEKSWCDKVYTQPFIVRNTEYKNIICYFDWQTEEKVVVWAHYDSYWEYSWEDRTQVFWTYQWADDNASWVAWVLELSRLIWLDKTKLKNNLELVAYTLEEPPFFDSIEMWSYVHAKSLFDNWEDLKYMISLEMIWYFSEKEIQEYPVRFLSRFYPKKWNFIAIIWEVFDSWIKDIKEDMLSYSDIETKSLSAPKFIQWVDFSDHRNYWEFWYKAYMITDTSFFRNKNYHTAGDTIDTLDFSKMKEVVSWVYGVLID